MSVTTTPPPASPSDLETRVANRKQELVSEILEHKKNSSRAGAADAVDKIKARLSELAHIVKEGVVDGWANVGPRARLKLDEWISK
ncbi:MAG: hypothetical protein H0V17_10765 [Deltaproteobacteria bacterium]|nr:hypothetical protein [Deltaproteobacteria bacterium]